MEREREREKKGDKRKEDILDRRIAETLSNAESSWMVETVGPVLGSQVAVGAEGTGIGCVANIY